MPQQFPSFEEATQNQQRWGSPPVSDQILDVLGKVGSIGRNAMMAGPDFMKQFMEGNVPPEQQGPEALKTMAGYTGMNSLIPGSSEATLNALRLRKLDSRVRNLAGLQTSGVVDRYGIIDESPNIGTFTLRQPGHADVHYDPDKKHIHVENIEHQWGPNKFGTIEMRDIIQALKDEYPESKTIGGYRVSGARAQNRKDSIPYVVQKLRD